MLRRLAFLWWLLVAVGVSPAAAAERIVAIGDLHGDWAAWTQVTRAAGLTDQSGKWRGGRTILVQTGDVVDRGPDSLRILTQIQRWQREAPRAGGQVIFVVGNHEAMMMIGDLRYVHPGEYAAFAGPRSEALREAAWERSYAAWQRANAGRPPSVSADDLRARFLRDNPLGAIELRAAWSPRGALGRWLIAQPAVVRLGSSIFVHGGLTADYARLGIDAINAQVRAALTAQDQSLTGILSNPMGPLWYRGHVTRAPDPEAAPPPAGAPPAPPRAGIVEELDTVLGLLGAKRLVIGHTPSRRGIIVDHGGKLVRIDSAMAAHYGGPRTWLEIRGDTVTPHLVPA